MTPIYLVLGVVPNLDVASSESLWASSMLGSAFRVRAARVAPVSWRPTIGSFTDRRSMRYGASAPQPAGYRVTL